MINWTKPQRYFTDFWVFRNLGTAAWGVVKFIAERILKTQFLHERLGEVDFGGVAAVGIAFAVRDFDNLSFVGDGTSFLRDAGATAAVAKTVDFFAERIEKTVIVEERIEP